MNAEARLEMSINCPDFLAVSGSRLYGTNVPTSDYDLRGFTIPPFEYLLNVKKFECRELEGDHKVFSLARFLELILKGDPQCTELLFVKPEHIKSLSPAGVEIMALKSDLISHSIYNRIMGYSYSEWRKAMGERLLIDERTITEDNVVNDIRNMFSPEKEEMDQIIDILMSKKDRKIVPSKADLGSKRKAEFDKYGYGVSNAAHSIRLVTELQELILTGTITFPRPNADILRDIRHGRVDKQTANEIYEEAKFKTGEAKFYSVLPDKPNRNKVWDTYTKIVANRINISDRFHNLIKENNNEQESVSIE